MGVFVEKEAKKEKNVHYLLLVKTVFLPQTLNSVFRFIQTHISSTYSNL